MHSLSTTSDPVAPLTSACSHPRSRETATGLAVLGTVLAAVVWSAVAQVRSQLLPGEAGPETAAVTLVD